MVDRSGYFLDIGLPQNDKIVTQPLGLGFNGEAGFQFVPIHHHQGKTANKAKGFHQRPQMGQVLGLKNRMLEK